MMLFSMDTPSIPLLAEEGWRDSLIEAGAPPRLRLRCARRSHPSSARRGMLNSFPYGIRESWTFRIKSVAFVPRSHDLWFETMETLGSGRRRGAAVHSKRDRKSVV